MNFLQQLIGGLIAHSQQHPQQAPSLHALSGYAAPAIHPGFLFTGNTAHGQPSFHVLGSNPVAMPQVQTNLQQLPDFTSSSVPYTVPNALQQNRGGVYQGPAYFNAGGPPMPRISV